MKCRLCTWLCDRLCSPEANSTLWRATFEWEEDYASDWEPAETGDGLRERWSEAKSLFDEDPAAALAIHLELAERGSAFSKLQAGWHHAQGYGTEKDAAAAEEFYRRALCAGSWKATLRYADLLFKREAHDKWPSTLEDGVRNGFIPSYFWLAWYRYKRSPNRRTAREVRHLLETAADAGHPGAGLMLARLAATGKFGLREILPGYRRGIRTIRAILPSSDEGEAARADTGARHHAAPASPIVPAAPAVFG
jgi:hypothetical protein